MPPSGGGLLGRQLHSRREQSRDGVPGPGTHEAPKGMGATKPVPAGGMPRPRPFYAAHLKALGSFPAAATDNVLTASASSTEPLTHTWGSGCSGCDSSRGSSAKVPQTVPRARAHQALMQGMVTPTAHIISYAR